MSVMGKAMVMLTARQRGRVENVIAIDRHIQKKVKKIIVWVCRIKIRD